MFDVIIIGAGIAGTACAQDLSDTYRTLVLEKSRGVGGRAATRYHYDDNREIIRRSDHGAQFFTVRSNTFGEQVTQWENENIVETWSNGFHHWQNGILSAPVSMGHPRFSAPLGMNQLSKSLARPVKVSFQEKITQLSFDSRNSIWEAITEEGKTYQSTKLILAIPAPQVLQLLENSALLPEYYDALRKVSMQPTFALMAQIQQPVSWKGITCEHSVLSWLSYDTSKRSNQKCNTIIAHATHEYSQANLEKNKEQVTQEMLEAVTEIDPNIEIIASSAVLHRWLYAKVVHPHPAPFIDFKNGIYTCGDWCGGDKLEDAYLSGIQLAKYLKD